MGPPDCHREAPWVAAGDKAAAARRQFPASIRSCPAPAAGRATISFRLYSCARCRAQVRVCAACDRGNRYCAGACAAAARAESARTARRRYERSPAGRERNRVRQKRYRSHRRPEPSPTVTHQGSAANGATALIPAPRAAASGEPAMVASPTPPRRPLPPFRCAFCGRPLGQFARQEPIRPRGPRRGRWRSRGGP